MARGKGWKVDQVFTLRAMLRNNASLPLMAARIGRSQQSVRQKIINLARSEVREAASSRFTWSDTAIAELFRLRDAGLTFVEIGAEIGRPERACRATYHSRLSSLRAAAAARGLSAPSTAQERAFAERDARLRLDHPSITAAVLGDPLPGRSALDMRGGGV